MSVLNEQIARLKARYQASPLPGFLAWWRDELLSLLPAHWRQRLWPPRARLFVTLDHQSVHLWRASGNQVVEREQLTLDLEQDSDFAREQVRQLLATYKDAPPQIVLCMPESQVLSRRIAMPAAAESGLTQALYFEMDRHTPFSHGDVYFDYRIAGREKDENLIQIDLYVTLRATLDRLIHMTQLVGLGLDAVDMNPLDLDRPPQPVGVNLLPAERRVVHRSRQARFNWALAGLAVVLLGAVMFESLYLQEATIARLEEKLDTAQQEVRIVRSLRSELEDAVAAAGFLGEKKERAPAILPVLAEVTHLLPQDTWVQRMQLTGTELQLQGLSDGAQKLIELLNSTSKLEGTYFKGATTTDRRLNKERFTVAANIITQAPPMQDSKNATASRP